MLMEVFDALYLYITKLCTFLQVKHKEDVVYSREFLLTPADSADIVIQL